MKELSTKLQIVNPDPRYSKAKLIEPTTLGYIYMAAALQPGPIPLVLPSARRSKLLMELKDLVRELERLDDVVNVTVFRAIVMPPTARFSSYLKEREASLHIANFDVFVLIQTTSPMTTREVQTTPAYSILEEIMLSKAEYLHIIAAHNARRIGDVDITRQGLFLFNHFTADDPDVILQLWEHLASWYAVETGLDNSIAMVPLDGEKSDYAIINWARWDASPLQHFWHQLSRRSFWSYVTANLEANRAGSMPIYCRLA
jgi:hypothetical protein